MKQSQEKVWDGIAEQWHHFRQKPFSDIVVEIENMTKNFRDGKILEIGCGNCRNLLDFAKADFDCYGIDFSSEMLKYAKEYCKKHKIKVKLKKARAEKLPFKKEYFDYILCIATLHHLNKKEQEKSVKEMNRVLKHGGLAFITVWNKFPLSLFVKEKYENWTRKGKPHHRYYYLFTVWELKKLIRKYGFKIIKTRVGKNISLFARKI